MMRNTLISLSVVIAFLALVYAGGVYRPVDRFTNFCSSSRFGLSARCFNELVCDNFCFSPYNSFATIPQSGKHNSAFSVPSDPAKTKFFTLSELFGRPEHFDSTSFRFTVIGDKYGENIGVKIFYDWNGDGKWDRVESFDSFHIYQAGKAQVWYEKSPRSVLGDQNYKPFYNGRVKVVFWQFGPIQGRVRILTDCNGRSFSSVVDLPYDGNQYWDSMPGGHKREVAEEMVAEEMVVDEVANELVARGDDGGYDGGNNNNNNNNRRGLFYASRCPVIIIPIPGPGNQIDCSKPSTCNDRTRFAVTGNVFFDRNQNGIDDDDEEFEHRVTITLFVVTSRGSERAKDINGKVLDPIVLGEKQDKHYAFPNLPAGRYFANFASPNVKLLSHKWDVDGETMDDSSSNHPDRFFIWTCPNRDGEQRDSDVDPRTGNTEVINVECGKNNIFNNNGRFGSTDCYYSALSAGAQRWNRNSCINRV